jgi:hypothetical protein
MARSRNIKPGFFTHDGLADLSPLNRLLFIGIWTVADRAGRLEDRPRRIKAEVMPYDDCDVDAMLTALAAGGFIRRYVTPSGVAAIQILAWDKHQNPHMKEAESTIQAWCEHGASTELADKAEQPSTERARLIPDSLNLIPDSSSVAKATGGKPPKVTDPEEIIFGYGLPLLTAAGNAEKHARSFLGGLRKSHGDGPLIDALRQCIAAKPLQPLEWLAAALPPGGKKDVQRMTTAADPRAGDALKKIDADKALTSPPPAHIRAQIADALKGKVLHP